MPQHTATQQFWLPALSSPQLGCAPQDTVSSESDDEVHKRKLQLYERSRLRYYYAIVDCADVATAAHLYDECDGLEFLRSACKFDLRFVPDEQVVGCLVYQLASQHGLASMFSVLCTASWQSGFVSLCPSAEVVPLARFSAAALVKSAAVLRLEAA